MSPEMHDKLEAASAIVLGTSVLMVLCIWFTLMMLKLPLSTARRLKIILWAGVMLSMLSVVALVAIN